MTNKSQPDEIREDDDAPPTEVSPGAQVAELDEDELSKIAGGVGAGNITLKEGHDPKVGPATLPAEQFSMNYTKITFKP